MYTIQLLLGTVLALTATAAPTTKRADTQVTLSLSDNLKLAPTALDRFKLLNSDPSSFVFDFMNPQAAIAEVATTTGKGGHTVKADSGTFPALIGNGVGMTVGFIGPCGFNTPHTHPRASEFNIVVKGTLQTEILPENGVTDPVRNTLGLYQSTIFPQGALHTEFNPTCEDAVFVAAFGNEDPGVLQGAQSVLGLDGEVVEAMLGEQGSGVAINGVELEAFRSALPKNVALGVESCLRACRITV